MVIQIVQKLSLTTGALVPSGIAKFLINYFLNSWRGGGTREVKTVKFAVGERGDSKCDVGDIR